MKKNLEIIGYFIVSSLLWICFGGYLHCYLHHIKDVEIYRLIITPLFAILFMIQGILIKHE